eukprot:CAMPEP_0117670446 /NCGR_PEP_ID=MMETSP0804-20121206/12757_1 /TAXON_ID=1074897 /ORGANISM="Tetraselmis astigmatica, Strain CCMP880" /LENGTH=42 /DNA_ID= /DNA_START= /DNA_END= /DNA_ORIENTATION=
MRELQKMASECNRHGKNQSAVPWLSQLLVMAAAEEKGRDKGD